MKERLKELRKALRLKQRDIAERLGVSVGLVGQWESGIQAISRSHQISLCREYNVRREWLETGEGEMMKPAPTKEDKYVEVFTALYEALPPNFQAVFRRIAREKLGANIPPDPAPSPTKSQANYGSVGGDMVQN